ncbi:hypothetical protein RS130_11920 [Paraglaciecola aquimarina]|uniref:Uncharacterized protein n=1 Tax=Paraglaciecola aquimarina TaxID=1235557 RepID=A0ABU3SX07_9ALTE|nr:hypothetical protein [Paraglaciecola aquimarina]MDU0354547.1 hypothetical protein [Paraglaciecola aquimarina]
MFNQQKYINIEQVVVQALGGQISSEGQLSLTDSLAWQGSTQIDSIDLAALLPDYPAQLNGELALSVNNEQGVWQGAIDKLDIHGSWLGYPLLVKGGLIIIKLME